MESLRKVVSARISRTLSVYTNTVSVVCLVQAGPVGANVCARVTCVVVCVCVLFGCFSSFITAFHSSVLSILGLCIPGAITLP